MNITTATLLVGSLAYASHASITTYSTRASFDTNAGMTTLEDFVSDSGNPVETPSSFDSGLRVDLTYGGVTPYIEDGDPLEYGFRNTAGSRNYLVFGQDGPDGSETGPYTISYSFESGSASAFGFDLSGFNPGPSSDGFSLATLVDGQITNDIFVSSDQVRGEVRFYGFIADAAFDEIQITISSYTDRDDNSADYVAFDGIAWNAVPAPSSAALLALCGLAGTRRRR